LLYTVYTVTLLLFYGFYKCRFSAWLSCLCYFIVFCFHCIWRI